MRLSGIAAANWLACAVLAGLAAVAVVLVVILGPFGLLLLGLLTTFVCTQFSLHEHAPSWGAAAMRAQIAEPGRPDARAAAAEARQAALAPVRFYQGCGVLLVVAGIGGLAWQHWG